MSYERFLECDYLDSQLQPASQMLRRCVQDPSLGLELSCTDKSKYLQGDMSTRGNIGNTMKPNLMDSLSIQRGHEMGIEAEDIRTIQNKQKLNPMYSYSHEGFTNAPRNVFLTDNGPGVSRVPKGQCPEGYSRCPQTGGCVQVCIGCKYNDNMKSQEFNDADGCFPNGVYDGIDKYGKMKCTCGNNNTYCSKGIPNHFSVEGSYVYDGRYRPDIGNTDSINHLYAVM